MPLGFNDTVSINMISILQMKDSRHRDAPMLSQITRPLSGGRGLECFNIHQSGQTVRYVQLPVQAVQDFLSWEGVRHISSVKGQTVNVVGFADHVMPIACTWLNVKAVLDHTRMHGVAVLLANFICGHQHVDFMLWNIILKNSFSTLNKCKNHSSLGGHTTPGSGMDLACGCSMQTPMLPHSVT